MNIDKIMAIVIVLLLFTAAGIAIWCIRYDQEREEENLISLSEVE